MEQKCYICIDLKSFYASVECVERGLDPLTTHLVVADESRTEKTICLAVSPALKAYGVPGRARLFEVVQKVQAVNAQRRQARGGREATGESFLAQELSSDKDLALSYIIAKPRMALYMKYSTRIYDIYLRYIAPEDMHIYSVDEVFIDVTPYLEFYHMSAHELALVMIRAVLSETGITATAGIGTNLYLAKVAMDVEAKHIAPDQDGVRIAELTEKSYREKMWSHRPITDFWRVGKGYAKKLEAHGLYTMGDIARCSQEPQTQAILYKLFGINAELLIDHAWGYEPCTMADIRAYVPSTSGRSAGQVMSEPTPNATARLIIKEMADNMAWDLAEHGLLTDQIVLTVNYDTENLKGDSKTAYKGETTTDFYGRIVPKHAHGTVNLSKPTASNLILMKKTAELFGRITDPSLTIRRLTLAANHLSRESDRKQNPTWEQMSFFDNEEMKKAEQKETALQGAILKLKRKYGKNAVLKGMNLEQGATAQERNKQIGGHKE